MQQKKWSCGVSQRLEKAKSKRPEPKAKALASGWKRHDGAEGSAQRAHPATSAGDAAGFSICQCASSCCWSCVRVSSCRGVLASSLTIATTQVCDSGSPWPAWCSAPLLPFSLPLFSPAGVTTHESVSGDQSDARQHSSATRLQVFQAESRGGERDVLCSVSGRGRRGSL